MWRRSCQALRALVCQVLGWGAVARPLTLGSQQGASEPWPEAIVGLKASHPARPALRAAIAGVAAADERPLAWLEIGPATHWPLRRSLFSASFYPETVFVISMPTWPAAWRCIERLGRACPRLWWIVESDMEVGYGLRCSVLEQRRVLEKTHSDGTVPQLGAQRRAQLEALMAAEDGKLIVLLDDIGPNPCEKSP